MSTMKILDLTNQRFERLVVTAFAGKDIRGRARWHCRCDCGDFVEVASSNLRTGTTSSCGCLKREQSTAQFTTHGMKGTPTYETWLNMVKRCTNPKATQYKWYGGRGITVDPRWMQFENFYADMGERPKGMTIDRIENDKGYCKANCRWATKVEQMNNQSTTLRVEHQGETKTLREWAEHLGIKKGTLYRRWKRTGEIDGINTRQSNARKADRPCVDRKTPGQKSND